MSLFDDDDVIMGGLENDYHVKVQSIINHYIVYNEKVQQLILVPVKPSCLLPGEFNSFVDNYIIKLNMDNVILIGYMSHEEPRYKQKVVQHFGEEAAIIIYTKEFGLLPLNTEGWKYWTNCIKESFTVG